MSTTEEKESKSGAEENVKSSTQCIALFKKRHRTSNWDKISFQTSGTQFLYSIRDKVEHWKTLELYGASTADVDDITGYPYAFSLKQKGSSRMYYFATTNEEDKVNILNVLCDMQFMERPSATDSSACSIQ